MNAMVLNKSGEKLQLQKLKIPQPTEEQVLISINSCGICLTDLHILDGVGDVD